MAKPRDELTVGLCVDCRHHRRVESAKGSVFHLCRVAESDPAYRKYPQLPVLRCEGHDPVGRENR